jgi:hypothetical protein
LVLVLAAISLPTYADAAAGAATTGTSRAVIVGVSRYDNLPEGKQLLGPQNDAVLVRQLLLARGFEARNVTTLADGVPGAGRPTRAAIMGALDDLVAAARRGDFIYLHFSGHGSQQPARQDAGPGTDPEPDGFDEIFLPRDIGAWDGQRGTVDGALRDDDIGRVVRALRTKGAFVWVVFDSCHSGDMTRGVPVDDERDRRVDFLDLVRPADRAAAQSLEDAARAAATRTRGEDAPEASVGDANAQAALSGDAAGFVAFFAAQTTETTPEMRLPAGQSPRQSHGLFTYSLVRAIQEHPQLTYRQLMQQVLTQYQAMNRVRPTPLQLGTDLDAPVFGSAAGPRVEQYALAVEADTVYLAAGSLQQLGVGSIVKAVPQPAARDDQVLGFFRVAENELMRSRVEPLAFGGKPLIAAAAIPRAAYGRPVERVLDLSLRIAMPPKEQAAEPGYNVVEAAVAEVRQRQRADAHELFEWVAAGEPADLRLGVAREKVWLIPPWGQWCRDDMVSPGNEAGCRGTVDVTPSIGLGRPPGEVAGYLDESLRQIAKATNLIRIAESTDVAAGAAPAQLNVGLAVRRSGAPAWEVVPEGSRATFRHGDRLRFTFNNASPSALDVAAFFVDARWGVTQVFPSVQGGGRLAPNDRTSFEGSVNTRESAGLERVVVISALAGDGNDFSELAQPALSPTRGPAVRGGDGLQARLLRAGFVGGATRGFDAAGPEAAAIRVIGWQTLPGQN